MNQAKICLTWKPYSIVASSNARMLPPTYITPPPPIHNIPPTHPPTCIACVQLKEQKNQMLRALADAENARTIARRDVENAKLLAIEK